MRKREIVEWIGMTVWAAGLPYIAYYGRVLINVRKPVWLEFRSALAKQRKIHWKKDEKA